eukprot:GFKZ01005800.1.p1 GENE.GFKZ01005800.1~~GFKZ01005800.1.p1  ORF type:complete len:283 (+),score=50.89 GFKZ01005800.1:121-849(+)
MSPRAAFLTPSLPFSTASGHSATAITTSSPAISKPCRHGPARLPIYAATAATKQGGKKKAPTVFSKDLKGNIVWVMRSAQEEDVDALTGLFKNLYPRDLVESLVNDSPVCTVCEASVKGSKEGEGYKDRLFGAVLADVQTMLKDVDAGIEAGTTKLAEILCTAVDMEMPDREDVRQKLILGAMKKMKDDGVSEVIIWLDPEYDAMMELYRRCLFKQYDKEDGKICMKSNLALANPDPQKKML